MSARLLDGCDAREKTLFLQNREAFQGCAAQLFPAHLPPLEPRTGVVRFLKLGRATAELEPTVSGEEILQARALFPPVT